MLKDHSKDILHEGVLLDSSLLGERIYPTGYNAQLTGDLRYLRFNVVIRDDAKG